MLQKKRQLLLSVANDAPIQGYGTSILCLN